MPGKTRTSALDRRAKILSDDFAADVAAVQSIAAVPMILDVACRLTGMGFAAVARVTDGRWVACGVRDTIDFGLAPGGELKLETTICNEIRQTGEGVAIDHVSGDEVYRRHPTPALYGFESYISMPIVLGDGRFFGTLCAIDPGPARVNTPETIGALRLFAELIAFHLDAHDRIAQSEANLLDERRTAELREQFIAVLGHDLRNPLASIDAGASLLLKAPHDERTGGILALVQASVGRMSDLIDNLLDFARGRLGGGMTLTRRTEALEPVLTHVVEELRAGHAGREIWTDIALATPVACDPGRIAQMLSNLVGNALTHGAETSMVRVAARSDDDAFVLSVANDGAPIPGATLEHLFQPFERGASGPGQQGLGLGLFIAAEIARAHGGELTATSTTEETMFTFRMPLG
jgi:signal transduction histidine kinase